MPLPGIRTVLRDRFASLGRNNDDLGERVVVIARRGNTATTTYPDYEPYRARDEADVITGFSEDSEVHRAYLELVAAGANNIHVIPVPSATAEGAALYTALEDFAYPAAEAIGPDILVPYGRGSMEAHATPDTTGFGVHADHASVDFAQQLARWCALITNRSNPVIGVIGVAPFNDGTQVPTAAQVSTGIEYTNVPDLDDAGFTTTIDGESVKTGRYISIVAAEVKNGLQKAEWGYGNGATTYAGLISTLPASSAPTNKTLYNVTQLRWAPTRAQAESLTDKKLVTFTLDVARTPVVADAPTYAPEGSDYGRLSTMRIVLDSIELVRTVATRFIGEAATMERRNSLETAIRSALQGMRTAGALLDYDFLVTYFGATNTATVDLILRPAFELREIKVQVQIDVA